MGTFEIQNVFDIVGRGIIVIGIVKSGEISTGMWGKIENITVKVKSIEKTEGTVEKIKIGEKAGLLLEGIEKKNIKVGQLILFE